MSKIAGFVAPKADATVTLAVGWQSGQKLKIAKVSAKEDVADAFREVCQVAGEVVDSRELEQWSPEADLTPETCLVAPRSALGDRPVLAPLDGNPADLPGALYNAPSLQKLEAGDLPAADLTFYAFVVGDAVDDRTVFLRRSNPRRGLRRGKWFAALGDSLVKVEKPIFAFDDEIDLIFQGDQVFVLSHTAFAMLFRSNDALAQQVPKWVGALKDHVPISKAAQRRLSDKVLRDSRLKRRLEAIVTRGHLESVTVEQMRVQMKNLDLDPDRLLDKKGRLVCREEDVPDILHFLNEDLFFGALSNEGFRADRKAAR